MATENLVLDAVLASANITGATVANLNAQDGNWAVASSTTAASEIRASFPTPSGSLSTGTQTFIVQARKQGGSGAPFYTCELWENGALIASLGVVSVTSTIGVVNQFTFDRSSLADPTGAGVEIRVVTEAAQGGSGVNASIDYGFLGWTVDLDFPERVANLTATLDNTTLIATAGVFTPANLTATLDNTTLIATAGVFTPANLTATLDNTTLSATAGTLASANLTATLDDATLASTAEILGEASLTATLDDTTLIASATLTSAGTVVARLTATLDDVVLVAQAISRATPATWIIIPDTPRRLIT